jgi:hypothetical protein
MGKFFAPNIDRRGRIARLVFGLVSIVAGVVLARYAWWVCLILAVFRALALYEAARGWCIMRACGIRTKF